MAINSAKRSNDDNDSLTLSYHSVFSESLVTPPDKRLCVENEPRTNYTQPAQSIALSQTLQSQHSLSSPPPSPLNVNIKSTQNTYSSVYHTQYPEEWSLSEKPPNNITVENFDKAISTNLPEPIRLKQLLIWSAREAMKRGKNANTEKPLNTNDRKSNRMALDQKNAQKLALELQQKIVQKLLNETINTSPYQRSSFSMNYTKKRPHPKNEANRQRIKEYEQALVSLQTEEYEWKEETSKLFDQHAAMLDDAPPSAADDSVPIPPTPITQDLLSGLDEDQKRFLEIYCKQELRQMTNANINNDEERSSSSLPRLKPSDMEIQITELRQRLSTFQQFQKCADKHNKDTMAKIARSLERGVFGRPIVQDSLEVTSDPESLKELDKEATKDILRMLSQYTNSNT